MNYTIRSKVIERGIREIGGMPRVKGDELQAIFGKPDGAYAFSRFALADTQHVRAGAEPEYSSGYGGHGKNPLDPLVQQAKKRAFLDYKHLHQACVLLVSRSVWAHGMTTAEFQHAAAQGEILVHERANRTGIDVGGVEYDTHRVEALKRDPGLAVQTILLAPRLQRLSCRYFATNATTYEVFRDPVLCIRGTVVVPLALETYEQNWPKLDG